MRGYQRRASIERKILTPILWVGIIPVTFALIVGYAITYQGQRQAVLRNLSTAAQTTANGLRLALESRLRTVETLSHDPEIATAIVAGPNLPPQAKTSLVNRLRTEGEGAPDSPSIYSLYDAKGSLVLSTEPMPEADFAHDTWPTEIQATRFIDFTTDRYFARSVAPVFEPDTNKRVGFLCEDQDASSLLYYALGHEAPKASDTFGSDVYQIAYRSRLTGLAMSYFDPGPPPALKMDAPDPKFEAAVENPKRAISGELRIRGYKTGGTSLDVLLAYYRFASEQTGSPMYIVVYRPAGSVFASINQWALYSVLGNGIIIALFLVFVYRSVHNNIVVPVSLLNEGAQIIRQGDLDLKLKIFTGDEIEELASSFNKMALHLSQNVRQLEDSEEKYRSLVTSMRDGIYQTDTEGVMTFANPAGAEILGYSSTEEALGQNLRELFLEEIDYARISNELSRQSFMERTRIWMKRKDGR
ncbi:MAG: PAS domain S-box protein, partial [Candidatus Eisenbacteria bacterium]